MEFWWNGQLLLFDNGVNFDGRFDQAFCLLFYDVHKLVRSEKSFQDLLKNAH
jgi:hypothetical protein